MFYFFMGRFPRTHSVVAFPSLWSHRVEVFSETLHGFGSLWWLDFLRKWLVFPKKDYSYLKKRRKISSLHVFCHVCIPKQGDGTAEYSCCRCLPSATYLPTQHFSHVMTTQWRKESHGLQHAITKEEKHIQSNIWYWNVRLQNVWARSGLQCQFA